MTTIFGTLPALGRMHRRAHDFEGYGVYELAGYGQLPPGVNVEDVVKHMDDYIIAVGNVQVATTNVQQPIMDVLDSMDFEAATPEDGITVKGVAEFSLLSLGSDFASTYRKAGYAIMADKTGVDSGKIPIVATQLPQTVADTAFAGSNYVVITAPQALIDAASGLNQQQVPIPQPLPEQEPQGLASWAIPAIIGVGAIAAIAVAVSASK